MPASLNPQLEMSTLDVFPLREPISKRAYTCLRLRTRSGPAGYGECSRISRADLAALRAAIQGKEASSFESIRRGVNVSSTALAGLNMAMLDIVGKVTKAPAYQVLGGPTRNKARVLARTDGETDDAIASAIGQARAAGYRAFVVPTPAMQARNHSATLVNATRQRLDRARSAGGEGSDFVLDAAAKLTPGDASALAAAFERTHLLWFDEPCPLTNLSAAARIAGENVTPIGFGRYAEDAGVFLDLLRESAIDIIRPDLSCHGITQIRRYAAVAEPYYIAVAPYHDGGPIATAAALQLAASLPNFFIQQVPFPAAEEDRRMRARLVGRPVEAVRDGFLQLSTEPGLGIAVDEAAFTEYQEREA